MEDNHGRRAVVLTVVASLTFVLLVLYVLSVGPAAQLQLKGSLASAQYQAIYYPLFRLCDQSPWLNDKVVNYIAQWGTIPDDANEPGWHEFHEGAGLDLLAIERGENPTAE